METIKDILSSLLVELRSPERSAMSRLAQSWPAIAGPRLAAHTKPSLGTNGKMFIWVDQSSLAFEISQKYRQGLLKRLQALLGEEKIKSVHVRVGQLR